MTTIGVIADTHGILLPAALEALRGSSVILHAGDVGPPSLLEALGQVAPVHAVYGNTDGPELRNVCPSEQVVLVSGVRIGIVHGDRWQPRGRVAAMAAHFRPRDVRVVVYGHTHQADVAKSGGILVFNPGSAGKRNFGQALSVGRLTVSDDGILADIVPIEP